MTALYSFNGGMMGFSWVGLVQASDGICTEQPPDWTLAYLGKSGHGLSGKSRQTFTTIYSFGSVTNTLRSP